MPCALCPVGGDVAKRQEYSNWRKLGFMDENNECSKDHRGDGSLWFWDSQEQLSRERHFWEEASGAHGFQFNHDSKLIHRGLQKISELSFEEVRKEGSCLNYNRYEELDSQDNSSSLDESQASQKVGQPRLWRVVEVRLKPWLSCAHNIVTGGAGFTEWQMSPHGPSPRHSPSTPLNMRGECIPFRPPSLDLK
ncbi:uncharacterized protein LOC107051951 isoform X1 [Gallus gallus]|uniref:uncharacterized protein LOC107051951 isoform X1 n=1 Tax=Gallus gallus TaxID=9031 RepID=UPI001AEA9A54|nr:uncharacterized protein LOC107051951 isoform X1 [Gallus gallus]XP_046792416.1 uncharacterized protein LOC107051951 isoform X1 [Gallus gallus]